MALSRRSLPSVDRRDVVLGDAGDSTLVSVLETYIVTRLVLLSIAEILDD